MAENNSAGRDPHAASPGEPDGRNSEHPETKRQREADEFTDEGAGSPEESLLATQFQESDLPSSNRGPSSHADSNRADSTRPDSKRPDSTRGSAARASSLRPRSSAVRPGSNLAAPAKGSAKPIPEYLEQFRILKELGAGAFGVVYMAEDESLQRRVAIKVPKVNDPQQAASYLNEARKAAAIDCEGIVPIYHVGVQANGVPFVVQKLIDGPTMRELLRRHGALPPAHAVMLMRDVAKALAVAHQRGIYHRDLKPDNVLIDSRGLPWIADFGLAISENEQVMQTGQIAGTLAYMSPEQIEGHVDWLDGRTDIWALGIMLYELLSGRPPFEGRTRQSLMQQICHRDPRPLQQRSANLLAELDEVFLGCCAKRPNDRFASAETLVAALDRLIDRGLSTEPIDGSELKSNQAISRYSSLQRPSQLSAGFSGSPSTRNSLDRIGPESDLSDRQAGVPVAASGSSGDSEAGPGVGEVDPAAEKPPPAAWRSVGMLSAVVLAFTAVIGGTMLSRWQSQLAGVAEQGASDSPGGTIDPRTIPGSGAELGSDPGPTNPLAGAPVQAISEEPTIVGTGPPVVPEAVPVVPSIEADGSAELPWIVASDGTGSHRSIREAVAASRAGDTIHIRPGIYNEAIRITLPLTLVGLGERGEAEIRNAEATPLEIACQLGTVQLVGLEVRGDGRSTGAEFNAINLLRGRLRIENCFVRSRVWNGIRMSPGTTLSAKGCQFLDSSQFAIVAKAHAALTVEDCQFFESGLQVIDGAATATDCEFLGSEGIYVQRSGGVKTVVNRCLFKENNQYAIAATESGQVNVTNCSFSRCQIGVEAYRLGNAEIRKAKFEDCQRAISVVDASVSLTDESTISGGQNGATMLGGQLRFANVKVSGASQDGVSVQQEGTLEIIDCEFVECQDAGINMSGGTLKLERSVIRDSWFAIYLIGAFSNGELRDVEFRDNNANFALVMEAGRLLCEQVRFIGGQGGIWLEPPADQTAEISLRAARFEGHQGAAGVFADRSVVTIFELEPADVPVSKLFLVSENAQFKADRN